MRSSGCTVDMGSDWRELAVTLERKIELTTELVPRQELRHSVAQVYEEHLDDIYQAISQLTAMLDDDANDGRALAELDRIYAKQKMWPELLDIVDKRALLATDTVARRPRVPRLAHRRGPAHRSRRGDPALRRRAADPAVAHRSARLHSRR